MKRFATEIEEMLSHNKILLTQNGPIHIYTNGSKIAECLHVENSQEVMEVDPCHEVNLRLDDATCNFLRKPGQIYHLYVHYSGKKYFSMISPEEWGTAPHKYIGSWRYEQNSTWTNTTFQRS